MAKPSEDLQDSSKIEYSIEGKTVDKDIFEKFTSSLQEIKDSYHCAKTTEGGRNSFEAIDKNGVIWIYRCVMKGDLTSYSVDKK